MVESNIKKNVVGVCLPGSEKLSVHRKFHSRHPHKAQALGKNFPSGKMPIQNSAGLEVDTN